MPKSKSVSKKPVRVRFAPSPTGFLHIGNARTALFNYLFALRHGGKFLLRIEDTDRERSSDEAVDVIFAGLKWLGIIHEGEPVFQSARFERHKDIAYRLLASGHAYKCYATAEEIEKLRVDAQESNHKIIYPDRDEHREGFEGQDFVVRLKTPMTGKTVIKDLIQGEVKIEHSQLDDFVLLRSDGTPTYMLAVVVDDIDMEITHIIRGDDHLINAFRQSIIYKALGVEVPEFAHMPLIHGSDGAKLSKRHGAMSVTDWQKLGYPAEMICNYLARLGWSFGDKEIFSIEEASKVFDLKNVTKSPARLDYDKINHLSGLYLRNMESDVLIQRLDQFLREMKQTPFPTALNPALVSVAELFKKRANNFVELANELAFFRAMPELDETASKLLGEEENKQKLKDVISLFETISDWKSEVIGGELKNFLHEKNLKMPALFPVIRAAIAGRTAMPDLPPILKALGKDEVLKRIKAIL